MEKFKIMFNNDVIKEIELDVNSAFEITEKQSSGWTEQELLDNGYQYYKCKDTVVGLKKGDFIFINEYQIRVLNKDWGEQAILLDTTKPLFKIRDIELAREFFDKYV
jgi:hypothetical protein